MKFRAIQIFPRCVAREIRRWYGPFDSFVSFAAIAEGKLMAEGKFSAVLSADLCATKKGGSKAIDVPMNSWIPLRRIYGGRIF